MSILPICIIACMTRFAFSGFSSISNVGSTVGTTCHEMPKRSFSQPQGPGSQPSVSFSQ